MRKSKGSIFAVFGCMKKETVKLNTTDDLQSDNPQRRVLIVMLADESSIRVRGIEFHFCTELSATSHTFTCRKSFQISYAIDKIKETERKHDTACQKGIEIKVNILVLTTTVTQICISH
jgi:hypothetical protein